MAAAYDTYNYPLYWKKRDYEHNAERIAISSFLKQISASKTIIDIGGGYGRLTPVYENNFDHVILTDPSSKLLQVAKKKLSQKHIKFLKATVKTLPSKIKNNSIDVALCVRVAHHISDIDGLFSIVHSMLKKDGYFIFEFANKQHLKAHLLNFCKGNFTFALDIFPKDIRSAKHKNKKTLPFVNYHPDIIKRKLLENGFDIIEVRSVSNIRLETFKRNLPMNLLMLIEKPLQKYFAKRCLGPSIFMLARKKG